MRLERQVAGRQTVWGPSPPSAWMAYRSAAATNQPPVWAMIPSSARSARGLAGWEAYWSSVWKRNRNSEQVERLGVSFPHGLGRVSMIAPAVRIATGWGSDAISMRQKSGSPKTQGRYIERRGLPSLGERNSPAPYRLSYGPAVSYVSPLIPRNRPEPDRPATAPLPYLLKKAPEKHRPGRGVSRFTTVGVIRCCGSDPLSRIKSGTGSGPLPVVPGLAVLRACVVLSLPKDRKVEGLGRGAKAKVTSGFVSTSSTNLGMGRFPRLSKEVKGRIVSAHATRRMWCPSPAGGSAAGR